MLRTQPFIFFFLQLAPLPGNGHATAACGGVERKPVAWGGAGLRTAGRAAAALPSPAFASDWGPRSAHRAAWASGFVDVVAESAYDLVRSELFSFIFVGMLLGSACPR